MMDDVGNNRDFEQTNLEMDLGITVDNNLKRSEHVLLQKFTTIFFDRSQLSLIDHSHNRSQM